jgi:hypothetical protein
MPNFYEQRMLQAEQIGCLPVSDAINHVYGSTATLLEKPTGKHTLVLVADKGGFRLRVGDYVASGMPSTEYPAAGVTNGSGALYLGQGGVLVMPGPSDVTVKGYAADSVLTYYWI